MAIKTNLLATAETSLVKQWQKAKTYVCYYGKQKVDSLRKFDVAVIESRNYTVAEIARIKSKGTIVVGYISIGEDIELRKGNGRGPGGYASYYIDMNGDNVPDQNPTWKSYYVNPGDATWQDWIIKNQMREVLEAKGCQGIFMDTMDSAEIFPSIREGMIQLVRRMQRAYPSGFLVANRGLVILESVAPYISGLMYEAFSMADYDWQKKEYLPQTPFQRTETAYKAVKLINRIREKYDFQVFALDYAKPTDLNKIQEYYDRAWSYNFLPYVSTIELNQVFIHKIKPKTRRGNLAQRYQEFDPIYQKLKKRINSKNIAFAQNGAAIHVSSTFPGYTVEPLNDGIRQSKDLYWALAAWASEETDAEHWVEVELAETAPLDSIRIYWAFMDPTYAASQFYTIYGWFSNQWNELLYYQDHQTNREADVFKIESPISMEKIKIVQSPEKGPVERPKLFWIAEIEVLKR
ncbi:endo alpha-1,4 polygalactosaminidase [candidate division KSB1 bacterium]|nr:endo alpha-1,4 polygalactosaminidase [candidate division KSB1 bacterium]